MKIGSGTKLLGPIYIWGKHPENISIGNRVVLSSAKWANPINDGRQVQIGVLDKYASIKIGNDVGISSSRIVASTSIAIGDRCLIGAGCLIVDTDFHVESDKDRRYNSSALPVGSSPVVIGDDVWLCANVVVLKGVNIGPGTIVAAGSVVSRNLPANVVAGGVPAKAIRPLKDQTPS